MTLPINIAAINIKASAAGAKQEAAEQIEAKDRMEAEIEESGFNSMAAARAIKNNERFKELRDRVVSEKKEEDELGDIEVTKIESSAQESQEDLADLFQRRNPELSSTKLRTLAQSFHSGSTEEDIYTAVSNAFIDPTLADEALDYLIQSTTGELKEKISRVRQLLNEEKAREIIAGRNIDSVAKDYATSLGTSATDLRNLYRNVTGDPKEHEVMFDELSQKYPFAQLKEVIAFLLKGMAYDMKSKGPSIQSPELVRLMAETRNLQSILWVYLFFQKRMGMIQRQFKRFEMEYPSSLHFEKLAKSFMKMVKERYPSVQKILKESSALGLTYDEEKAVILSHFRDAIRGLSPRVYKSVKHRQELLLALLETLDQLEAEEEEEEEEKK